MKLLSLKAVILAAIILLPVPGIAEDLTMDQKVDRLWKQSDLIRVGVNALQLQYASDESKGIPNGTGSSTLFIRRAELYAKGSLQENLSYEFVYDLSASTDPVRDAFVDLKMIPMVDIRLGQFRIPFGIETQTSSKKLLFIDRMLITNPDNEQTSSKGLTSVKSGFVQERDLGLRLSGRPMTEPIGIDYAIAVINGSDKNTTDKNDKKEIVGRLGISLMKGLTIGGSGYFGKSPEKDTTGAFTGENIQRNRMGADLEFRPMEPLLVRTEYISGKDNTVKFNGYYALIAYRLPINVEPVARYEHLDPDTGKSNNGITRTTLGVNYYLVGYTKVQVNYEIRDDKANSKVDNMALAQIQISF